MIQGMEDILLLWQYFFPSLHGVLCIAGVVTITDKDCVSFLHL